MLAAPRAVQSPLNAIENGEPCSALPFMKRLLERRSTSGWKKSCVSLEQSGKKDDKLAGDKSVCLFLSGKKAIIEKVESFLLFYRIRFALPFSASGRDIQTGFSFATLRSPF
ncbi:MAG: hypothetical protein K5657_08590 [Desulfovibrio sp.]|nr:hypothetical protein [Desulfovibrio sp.]